MAARGRAQSKEIRHFDNIKEDKLIWAEALFNNGNVKSYSENADGMKNSCHCEK
jgi:hypothetical protein